MFVKDPCGILCILITYIAVFYADYVIIKWIVFQTMSDSLWGTFNVVMFNTVIFLLLISHIKAVMTDPGTVPLPQSRIDFSDMHSSDSGCEFVNWTVCARCETYRPPRAHHCRICQRCIRRMDHHCPWINNCVGERNQKYFIQFLIYVGTLSVYAITLLGISWVNGCEGCSDDIPSKEARILHNIILFLESVLFGLFVAAILIDQMQSILSDETAVEQIQKKGPYRPYKPKMVLLREVCGREHPLLWLLPCSAVPKKVDIPLIDYQV
ncbi:palmitoyltransferase ZDHHC3 isoform X2 [Diorhabda sublineata]|uniref:palmitoyltransferase ZDHHC3 isoform X2 n=1 Tax=Diorhabda sublineata TaxID=1163346 RepID=UPI0024E08CDD|nr:palmitoyltransferase ZDHHC3 isoform X2 [Diorhabda sublineata]